MNSPLSSPDRRTFLKNSLQIAGGAALLGLPVFGRAEMHTETTYTVQDIINIILKEVKIDAIPNTIDTLKYGKADTVVTGIISTMFPTVAIIEQAVKLKANLIIVHEPTFYSGLDRTEKLKDNEVMKKKKALLDEHGIVIWRFHDYSHMMKPDLILEGFNKKMGWKNGTETDPVIHIPATDLRTLVQQLKKKLSISHVRVMGDLSQSCRNIALLPGAWGVDKHVEYVEKYKPDVILVGEQVEWETTEYFRDGRHMGLQTSMIILGHAVSEEPGMDLFAPWLRPKVPGITVTHIATGDPYTWL